MKEWGVVCWWGLAAVRVEQRTSDHVAHAWRVTCATCVDLHLQQLLRLPL